jgi:hypothetical protein
MPISYNDSRLSLDIDDIKKPPSDPTYHQYFIAQLKLHTVKKDLTSADSVFINSIRITRDYINNISDYIEIEVLIPQGTFFYDVYDNLDNLEATVIMEKQYSPKKNVVKTRYRAIYLLDKNKKHSNIQNQTKEDLNQLTPMVITLQLVDRSVEVIRLKTVSGSFDPTVNKNKDMSIKGFLNSVISTETSKILIENRPSIEYLDIEEPDNTEKLQSIVIKSNTRLVELADYIQEKNIGIYNGGVGAYIQNFATSYTDYKKTYFIYSLYNTNKYDKAKYKMIIYVPNMSTGTLVSNVNYKYDNFVLRVLSFKVHRIEDNKDSKVMSHGTGFKVSSARSIMKKPVELDENQNPVFKQENFVTNIVYADRPDGINYSPNLGVAINQLQKVTETFMRRGNYISVEVSHLDPDYIAPGAKVKLVFEHKNGNIYNMYSVVHKCFISYTRESNSPIKMMTNPSAELYCKMVIMLFCLDSGVNLDA